MPIITPRDVDIFRTLASGPATSFQIRMDLRKFMTKDPGRNYSKGDVDSRDMSADALKVRLSKLMREGYVASRLYPEKHGKGAYALYVLAPLAVELLVQDHNFNPKHIRTALPNKYAVSHELQVVDIVKTIKREGGRLGYQYDIEDENYLKGESRGAKKNMPYPDLHVRLFFKVGKEVDIKNFAVELDNGTMKVEVVAEKARRVYEGKKWISMFICPNSQRIAKLRAGFARYIESEKENKVDEESKEEIDKLYLRSFFATSYEFHENGFLKTKWLAIEGGNATVVPDDYGQRSRKHE